MNSKLAFLDNLCDAKISLASKQILWFVKQQHKCHSNQANKWVMRVILTGVDTWYDMTSCRMQHALINDLHSNFAYLKFSTKAICCAPYRSSPQINRIHQCFVDWVCIEKMMEKGPVEQNASMSISRTPRQIGRLELFGNLI
jgi:hypothetical protein